VARQPLAPAQGCVVTNGQGTIGVSDVVTVIVSCRNAARFAYVANYGGNNLTQFAVGSDGGLSLLATPLVAAGVNPTSLALDPLGRYLYVALFGGNSIAQFSIADDASLVQISTTFQVNQPIAMVIL
jgi:6-phosphogluconolactonase